MKKRAVIFDIDGTAIDSPTQKEPTERLVKAATKIQKDYYLCAATGRVWTYAKIILQGMKLEDPCIISSGTQLCNPQTGKILWQCDVEPTDLQAALAVLRHFSEYKILYNEYEEKDYLYGGHNVNDVTIDETVYFLCQAFVPVDVAPKVVAELSKIKGLAITLVVAQRPGFNDIHITNKNATKEHAVAELLKVIKVDRTNTIGVGDGHNDIHLFNAVAHKVAMANAVDDLKAVADEVIGDVRHDGLTDYLEKLADS